MVKQWQILVHLSQPVYGLRAKTIDVVMIDDLSLAWYVCEKYRIGWQSIRHNQETDLRCNTSSASSRLFLFMSNVTCWSKYMNKLINCQIFHTNLLALMATKHFEPLLFMFLPIRILSLIMLYILRSKFSNGRFKIIIVQYLHRPMRSERRHDRPPLVRL